MITPGDYRDEYDPDYNPDPDNAYGDGGASIVVGWFLITIIGLAGFCIYAYMQSLGWV